MDRLPDTLRLGTAHLTVTSLDRALPFYRGALGLRLHWRDGASAGVGTGNDDLIVLTENPDARPAGRHAGLYHVAILHPSHEALAHAALRLARTRTPILGASDHGTHDAIYLPDPDGNELELAADNAREQWPDFSEAYAHGPRPLDLHSLVAEVASAEPHEFVEARTAIGHIHLFVGDVDEAVRFYGGALGFEEQMRLPTASFLSAGGYHHHVAVNVWRGEGIPPAPANVVGLRHWTVVLDEQAQVDEVVDRVRAAGYEVEERDDGALVRDPWNIALLLTESGSTLAARPRSSVDRAAVS